MAPPLDEVKRAYRRLAKANHPDAAGEASLPRFLAIQAAYERLLGPADGAVNGSGAAAAPRQAWDADPHRSDATRRAYGGRGRARRRRRLGEGRQRFGQGARRSRRNNLGTTRTAPSPRTRRRDRNATARCPAAPEPAHEQGHARLDVVRRCRRGEPSNRTGVAPAGTARRAAPTGRSIPRNTPILASTAPNTRRAPVVRSGVRPATRPTDTAPRAAGPTHTTSSWWDSTAGAAGWASASGGEPSAPSPSSARPASPPPPDPPTTSAPFDLGRSAADFGRLLVDEGAGGMHGRIVRAIVGWTPIAIAIGWIIGEMTGCGRFAATCDGSSEPLVLGLQIVTLAILLVVPALAALATIATMTVSAAAVFGARAVLDWRGRRHRGARRDPRCPAAGRVDGRPGPGHRAAGPGCPVHDASRILRRCPADTTSATCPLPPRSTCSRSG